MDANLTYMEKAQGYFPKAELEALRATSSALGKYTWVCSITGHLSSHRQRCEESAMKSEPFEIQASEWFNTPAPLKLTSLKGRVVILGAFQMLCPACVAHSIPQLKKLHQLFREAPVAVIGLHTVFEHHAAMQPVSLKAFIHEYGLEFPIGVDAPSGEAIPLTMQSLKL